MKPKPPSVAFPRSISIALLCAGVALPARIARADDTPPSATATNTPARLPAVTVTAQKEPQAAQSLPVSVTAVTGETLRDADITAVKQAAIYAPNTFINEFTARAVSNPFFRGLGGSPANPGVTTFIDGVPQLNSYSANLELVDVDQVEFVRGPQGALFGRNTAGGLINITSRHPLDMWTAAAEGGVGNYDFRDVRGDVSGPLAKDKLALDVGGGYSARDGYTVNDFNGSRVDGREAEFGKGQLLLRATDRFELRLIVSGEHDRDGDYALGDLAYIRANPNHVDHDFLGGFNHRDVASGTLLADYYGESVEFSSISGWVWWKNDGLTDLDYTPAPGNTHQNTEQQNQYTQEFRLASAKDRPLKLADNLDLAWQGGIFLFADNYKQATTNTQPVTFIPGFVADSQSSASKLDWGTDVYGQAKLTAWEKLDLSAGVRYDFEDKHANLGNALAFTPFAFPPFLVPSSAQQTASDTFSEVSPQFGLAYHFTTNHMVYGSVARGYKAGGFNSLPTGVPAPPGTIEYGTEHSWNYEVGAKSDWLDGKLETTLALFYIDWQNLQLNQQVPGGAGQFFIANAGAADSRGVEFEVKYRPVACWDLFGGVGYDEAKFLSGSTAFNPNVPPGVGSNQNVGGNRLPYTPSFTGNMGSQVSWAPCSCTTLYLRATLTACGDFVYDASNAQGQSVYTLADFRGGVRGDHWFVEGWADNAFNTHYVPIAIQYSTPSGYVGETGAPVTYGVRAGIFF